MSNLAKLFRDEEEGAVAASRDEVHAQRGDVALCFLMNRSSRTMRVIDFRSGAQPNKADLVREVAEREGIDRVYTVVEREESATWAKMGFEKEGNIPGFYKRSDAYILGLAIDRRVPLESETRIRIKPGSSAEDAADKAIAAAKRFTKNKAPTELPKVKITPTRPQDEEKAIQVAEKAGRALTNFAPFGRGSEHLSYLCTARGGFSLLVGVEVQPCFDNALLELLVAPRGDKETWLTVSGVEQVCAALEKRGIVSAFSVSPVESVELCSALMAAGFKKTGRMPGHLLVRGERQDAFLWSRKLADPE